jgi:hypothetical protein
LTRFFRSRFFRFSFVSRLTRFSRLKELGLTKNKKSVSTAEGRSIPDALTVNQSIEIKDVARVDLTTQLRIQTEAARASGRQSVLITGLHTHVSKPVEATFDVIIRKPDLGPQK